MALKLLEWETSLHAKGFERIAGVDEAGRGPLAGPVVAAACILPKNLIFKDLNDSKLLSASVRDSLYEQITGHPEVVYAFSVVDAQTIDKLNILQATFLAMRQAVSLLAVVPDFVLVDGNRIPEFGIPASAIVRGDSLSASIAAASIIAKVTRDRLMEEMDKLWPIYGFKKHKGYPTAAHVQAIIQYGPCVTHRRSFEPVKSVALEDKR